MSASVLNRRLLAWGLGGCLLLPLLAALLACWLPARRAAMVDPVKSLRREQSG